MGIVNLPRVPQNPTNEELASIVAILSEQLEYALNGFLDSTNAREFGGWSVGPTELQSKDKKVGMSTKNTVADDVRFWAGDLVSGIPKFKVTKAGVASLVSALVQSAAGYPRVELNSANGLFGAYKDASNYVTIAPLVSSTAPGLNFHTGTIDAFMYLLGTALSIITPLGAANIELSSGRAIKLSADTANGYSTQVDSWAAFRSTLTARTLQQDLDGKAANFTGVNGTVYVSSTSGGPATTAITFNNGVRTS